MAEEASAGAGAGASASSDKKTGTFTKTTSVTAASGGTTTTTTAAAAAAAALPRRAHTFRARSLGSARRESIQLKRSRRSEANARAADVPEEPSTDVEVPLSRRGTRGRGGGEVNAGKLSEGVNRRIQATTTTTTSTTTEQNASATNEDLAKPVYLKGLFSVSTTSTKSFAFIRADIKRVLSVLGVQYTDIKGGFSCRKVPSIDLVQAPTTPAGRPSTPDAASPS
ncbi:serine/threonine-protein kinase KIN2, partial [Ascosphaera aggregata]